jgi:flotillin
MVGMWYYISEPNAYLAVTGAGIDTVRITKKALVMPWQKVTKIDISPFDFSLALQAMTIEKISFSLPAVFTIGPDDNVQALQKYATLLSGSGVNAMTKGKDIVPTGGRSHVQDIVKGIIEGEARMVVSSMSMEEVFRDRKRFKDQVLANVQSELDQFGLRIYNANVKELMDTPGSEYFAYLSRKAHEGALNQAKVDVAEARMKGEIGEKQKQGRTKQEVSKIEAETSVLETERKGDKASAEAQLAMRQAELGMNIQLAQIKAKRQAEARDAELSRDVENKRAETEQARLRATDVTKAIIARESAQQKADAAAYTTNKNADAKYYEANKNADAKFYDAQREAEASYFRKVKEAEAFALSKQKEAEGIAAMADAYAKLSTAFGGQDGLLKYLMIEKGVYTDLAHANAQAIQGMQPKVSLWNTAGASGSGDGSAGLDQWGGIRNIFQALPPLLSTINEQTGISPPTWMAQMPQQQVQQAQAPQHGLKVGKTNGVA